MINLIYIILIAILAIHISKDAIEGYDIISNDYRPQIAQLQTYNEEYVWSRKSRKSRDRYNLSKRKPMPFGKS